jgi:hypothetical protein
MARKRTDSSESTAPLRLRIPPSLAVVLVGASATVAISFGACDPSPEPPPPDAGELSKTSDAGPDTALADGDDPLDAGAGDAPGVLIDAPVDAPPDTPHG